MALSIKKKHRIYKEKEEELPSFLKNIEEPPEAFSTVTKPKSSHYLGPLFFGASCKTFQPPLHVISLGAVRQGQRHTTDAFKQSIDELFYDYEEEKTPCVKVKEFHPTLKRKKSFYDPYPHKCTGTIKVFAGENRTPTALDLDLGTTTSIIEGDASLEIPLCRFRSMTMCRGEAEPEIEFIMPSDLREERWKHLSRIEQISHAHFPKRFVTVTVNGPNIPGSITITRLQCKRTREYDTIFLKKPGEEKEEGEVQKTPSEGEEAEESQAEEDMETESEAQADEQSLKSDAFSAETKSQQSVTSEKKEENVDEESEGKEGSFKMAEDGESVGEGEMENDRTEEGEMQEVEKTEEVEVLEEENPVEEEEEGA